MLPPDTLAQQTVGDASRSQQGSRSLRKYWCDSTRSVGLGKGARNSAPCMTIHTVLRDTCMLVKLRTECLA